jgi:predicted metal-dependent hydrolase
MKKGERIQAYVGSINTGSRHHPCYEAYFICFNERKYYEAHDVLEHLWLDERGPANQFFKGLIQLAGAFVHLQKQYLRPGHSTDGRRLYPAWRLFKLAHTNLEPFFPTFLDLDIRSVLDLCAKNMLAIERAEFKRNPWNPGAAPTLGLNPGGATQDS